MAAAGTLASLGIPATLIEQEPDAGGHVARWDRLFPHRRDAREVLESLAAGIREGVDLVTNCQVTKIDRTDGHFLITPTRGKPISTSAIIVTTGFKVFDARKKEEYGYGIYDNVITSADLEDILRKGKGLTTRQGKTPAKVAFIHCVGSRDEKAGNLYCSKVCCVTGVKQAIEIREMLPECEVYNFYMDLRMFDRHFEEMYLEAQQKWGINFIRGRLSECAENQEFSLVMKTEDTLTGKPLKMTVDLIVLLAGFVPNPGTESVAGMLGLKSSPDGFLSTTDDNLADNSTPVPGLFLAGAVKGPANIAGAITDARSAAMQAFEYLNRQ